jgi:hypothetical protein
MGDNLCENACLINEQQQQLCTLSSSGLPAASYAEQNLVARAGEWRRTQKEC